MCSINCSGGCIECSPEDFSKKEIKAYKAKVKELETLKRTIDKQLAAIVASEEERICSLCRKQKSCSIYWKGQINFGCGFFKERENNEQ